MKLFLNNKSFMEVTNGTTIGEILSGLGIAPHEYYLLSDGKLLDKNDSTIEKDVHLIFKTLGGKGGFGSMLRAIGAQIEKTTNREACRDLSGRRLRDINEEQRLKNWIATQAEREKEAAERKKKKLERLCELPKHEFKDESYDEIRSLLPEKVEDAVTQGLKASASIKRKHEEVKDQDKKKKKSKLWFDEEFSESGSDSDDDKDENKEDEVKPGTSKSSNETEAENEDNFNDRNIQNKSVVSAN